jgi:hypothetical protein
VGSDGMGVGTEGFQRERLTTGDNNGVWSNLNLYIVSKYEDTFIYIYIYISACM